MHQFLFTIWRDYTGANTTGVVGRLQPEAVAAAALQAIIQGLASPEQKNQLY
jgi:hypothetical protein